MKKFKMILVLVGLFVSVSGCGQSAEHVLVDKIGSEYLKWDAEGLTYSQAIGLIGTYLADATPENLAAAEAEVEKQKEHFQEEINLFQLPEVSEELKEALEKNELTEEDYLSLYQTWLGELQRFVNNLRCYQSYIELEKVSDMQREDLRALYESDLRVMDYTARFHYVSLNFFWAELDQRQLEYAEETYLSETERYSFEDLGWSNDREELELKLEVYLNRIEEEVENNTERLGEMTKEIYGY